MSRTLPVAAIAMLAAVNALAGRLHPGLEIRLQQQLRAEKLPIIVEMKEQFQPRGLVAKPSASAHLTAAARRARIRALVTALKDRTQRSQRGLRAELDRLHGLGRIEKLQSFWIFNGFALTADESVIRELAARDDVLEVRFDDEIPPPPHPSAAGPASGTDEWNIAMIHAPETWALGFNGAGTVVGSFDTGVDGSHPDLVSRYRGDDQISWFDPYGEHASPFDAHGHGTHTTATAVGGNAGGSNIGVAPGAKWIAAKAWDDNGIGSLSAFHQIFQWFLAPGGDPDNAPDVVNNSWSLVAPGCYIEFAPDIQAWLVAEIFPAFAAGNAGPSPGSVRSPGNNPEAFAVGATDISDSVASFSSRGPSPCTGSVKPDISAPGVDVRSALPDDQYGVLSGTSMATPHVTGAVAVLRSVNQALSVDELEAILTLGSTDLLEPGPDNAAGEGRLDLFVSAQLAQNGLDRPVVKALATVATAAELGSTPGQVTFSRTGSLSEPLEIKLEIAGSATPGVDYLTLPTSVTIPAGAKTQMLTVVPIDDTIAENNESVTVSIVPDANYILSSARVATVIIISDELFPDLVATGLTAPASGGPGLSMTVTETTRNQGEGPADASTTTYYLSSDNILDSADSVLASRAVPALAPGGTSAASVVVTIPADTTPGLKYLMAKADAADAVSEGVETNNIMSRFIAIGPDLAVTGLVASATAGAGDSVTVTETTANQGGAPASPSVTHYYLSTSGNLGSSAVQVASRSIPALAAGASSAGSVVVTIPANAGTGVWYLLAEADATGVVAEAVENNNVTSRSLQVGPDLTVSTMTVPIAGGAGQPLVIADTTKNQGGGSAGPSVTQYFLSSNAVLDAADTLVGSRAIPALAGGEVSSGSSTVTIPTGASTGQWYILARVDGDGSVAETVESNNVTPRSIQIGPDLTVSSLTVPASAGAGLSLTLTETTTNSGGGNAEASVTRYYLSSDYALDDSDLLLDTRTVPALAGGAGSSASISLTLPSNLDAGTWYLIAKADGGESVTETSELNNTTSRTVVIGPDLVMTALTVPASAGVQQSITISDTIKNQGGGTAGASQIRYFLSDDGNVDPLDTLIGSRDVSALAPGASSAGSTVVTIPAATGAGTFFLIAKADGGSSIGEALESNNLIVRSIQIGPDLAVTNLTAPTTAGAGQSLTVSDTINNRGGGTAGASVTRYYLSATSTLNGSPVPLGERTVPSLAPGASSSASTVLTIPAGTGSGIWYIVAQADADGNVPETLETNNLYARSVQLGPDLVFTNLSVPTYAAAGQGMTITETVKNQGSGAAGPSVTQYYLSANSTFDGSDQLLGARSVPGLAAGATSSGSTALTIPSGTPTGTWYVIAKLDGEDSLFETNEINNVSVRTVQIGADLNLSSLYAPSATGAGLSVTVSETTRNLGVAPAGASVTQYYLSTNSVLDTSDTPLGSRSVPALAAGGYSAGSATITIPPGTGPGVWYIIAAADSEGSVEEAVETNNVASRWIQIGPDLTVSVVAPSSIAAGATVSVTETTKNQGGGPAGASVTRYYLSPNSSLDGSDVLLAERDVAALAPGESSVVTTVLTIPAQTAAGYWYIIGETDATGTVSESAETNNTASRRFQVTLP